MIDDKKENLPEIFQPMNINRKNQRFFRKMIYNLPVCPEKFELGFYAKENYISGSYISINRKGIEKPQFDMNNLNDLKDLTLGGKIETIILRYGNGLSDEVCSDREIPLMEFYKEFIPLSFKNQYKLNDAKFEWKWGERFSKTKHLKMEVPKGITITNLEVEARLTLDSQEGVDLKFDYSMAHTLPKTANMLDYFRQPKIFPDKADFCLRALSDENKKDIIRLRNWFEHRKDVEMGQKFLFGDHYPGKWTEWEDALNYWGF